MKALVKYPGWESEVVFDVEHCSHPPANLHTLTVPAFELQIANPVLDNLVTELPLILEHVIYLREEVGVTVRVIKDVW